MRLLTINTGSSSLKAALYQVDAGRAVALGGECRADRAPRLLYLLEKRHLTATQLSLLVNERSGLRGVSGTSGDMRDLLEREATDPRAAEAIELFCFQARKFLGALATVLGGLDTLIFTGGIGEHAAPIRRRICANLEFLGIRRLSRFAAPLEELEPACVCSREPIPTLP